MADTPKLVSSMGRAELDRIFVRDYDLNKDLLGKITFAQMVYLMLEGRLPTPEQGRMIDAMLIVLVDHGMTTGAAAARMVSSSEWRRPRRVQISPSFASSSGRQIFS